MHIPNKTKQGGGTEMFMVKEDLHNIKNLTKAKLRSSKKGFRIYIIIMLSIMLINIISFLFRLFKETETPSFLNSQDLSLSIYIGLLIGFIIMNFLYRTQNDYLSIFPQTNNSRFLSTLLTSYITITMVGLTILLMYLIQYGTMKVISIFHSNIFFALNFDFGFVMIGFLTFLMYSFLAFSFMTLIATIIRKFRIYAMIVFIAIGVTAFANIPWIIDILPTTLVPILTDKSILWFFIKTIALLIIMNIISITINHFTVYYKTVGISKFKSSIFVFVALFFTIAFTMLVGTGLFLAPRESTSNVKEITSSHTEYQPSLYTLDFDISDLVKNSKINIITKGNILAYNMNASWNDDNQFNMSYDVSQSIKVTGNKLTIIYRYPIDIYNDINSLNYVNPKFSATMKGNTLYLNYEYTKNVEIIYLPIWYMAGQFEYYKDKNITVQAFGYSVSGGSGNINIIVE